MDVRPTRRFLWRAAPERKPGPEPSFAAAARRPAPAAQRPAQHCRTPSDRTRRHGPAWPDEASWRRGDATTPPSWRVPRRHQRPGSSNGRRWEMSCVAHERGIPRSREAGNGLSRLHTKQRVCHGEGRTNRTLVPRAGGSPAAILCTRQSQAIPRGARNSLTFARSETSEAD